MSETDQAIKKFSNILENIYTQRTAGDYTFNGVLFDFAREILSLEENK